VQGSEVQLATATILLLGLQTTVFWEMGEEEKTAQILSCV
jgi:hypothetical protein